MPNLWITASGASEADIRRGVEAAERYLSAHGRDAATIYAQTQAEIDAGTDCGPARNVWDAAELAAFLAAFAGMDRWPALASLVLKEDEP